MPSKAISHINFAIPPQTHTSMYLMHKYWARKPHNVVREYIEHYSSEGEVVLDLFSGSGVTAIDALKTNRKAIATLHYPKRGRSLLAFSAVISMLKKSSMQRQPKYVSWLLYKGAIEKNHS